MISQVYKVDYQTTDMTEHERLKHHQKHSKPVMDKLYEYLHYLLDEKLVEPNDDLGKAINYMIKHRHELTQFLRVEGVPLDNNVLEQCLKIPIRHGKTQYFRKPNTAHQLAVYSPASFIPAYCQVSIRLST